jgi:acetylglutamate kinase
MSVSYDRDALMVALKSTVPYLRMYRGKVFVIKLGGAGCSDQSLLRGVLEQVGVLSELGIRVVLVHGGGPQTTSLAGQLGLETTFVAGRRVTCERTLDISIMTLNGSVNTEVLAVCRALGISAIGVSGIAAGIVKVRRRPPVEVTEGAQSKLVDYGLVGDVVGVDGSVLNRLLDAGLVPVVSPLSADDNGQVLNVNADTVASAIAQEMKAEKLIFLTDAPGLLEDRTNLGSLVSYIDVKGVERLKEKGCIEVGMLPKIRAAIDALNGCVRRVHIVGHRNRSSLLVEIFTNEGSGTLIVLDSAELAATEQAMSCGVAS